MGYICFSTRALFTYAAKQLTLEKYDFEVPL